MSTALLTDITIFVLALLVGFEVISKVPATLHTPLMSAANSIHGIVLAGAMLIAVTANNALGYILAFVAAAFARNISSLLLHMVSGGELAIDVSDDIQAGVVIAHGGTVVHPATAALLADASSGR